MRLITSEPNRNLFFFLDFIFKEQSYLFHITVLGIMFCNLIE